MVQNRSCMLGTILMLFGLLCSKANAMPETAFRGELDYAAFRRAVDQGASVRIEASPGGTGASAMMLAKTPRLIIDGPCNSACAWAFVRHAHACFTPRATFGFHAAHDPGTGRRLGEATEYWLDLTRPSLRSRLSSLKRSSAIVRITAQSMKKYYPDRVCGSGATG